MNLAQQYVGAGLALVGIPTGKKGPCTKGWNQPERVVVDFESAVLLTENMGLAHAYCTPTPTMALDIDDLTKAKAWLADRGIDVQLLLDADDAVQISSGKEGHAKLLYRLPDGVAPMRTKQVTDPDTAEMALEFRCAAAFGLTMQDVLPPSIHPDTGKPYQWAGKGNWRNIPQIPDPLLAVWQAQLNQPAARSSAISGAADHSSVLILPQETIQHLRSALLSMRADDYNLWIKTGMALKSLGDVGRGLWLEWSLTSRKSQDD